MEDKTAQLPPRPATPLARRSRNPFKRLKRLLKNRSVVVAIVLILAVGAAVFFYLKYQDIQSKLNNPEIVAKQEAATLVEKVAQHIELPSDEQPTVATVSDVSKLADQTFFASAKNGDKVLIYSKAKKAILYRPSDDKVINVAPLNISDSQVNP